MDDPVARILAETDQETRFRLIGDLVVGRPDFAVTAARELLRSNDPARRILGADILGQVSTVTDEHRPENADLLRARLDVEGNPEALASAIVALGHLGDSRARASVVSLGRHSDAEVRKAVAFALPSLGLDDEALESLGALSRDPETEVRDWATFALAESDGDNDRIREALMERTADPDDDTRAEGIYGLARRRDPRAAGLVEGELARGSRGALIERARAELRS